MQNIRQAIQDLIHLRNTNSDPVGYVHKDISEFLPFVLNKEVSDVMNKRVYGLVHERNESLDGNLSSLVSLLIKLKIKSAPTYPMQFVRKLDIVKFFGVTVQEKDIEKGVVEISNVLNFLGSKGYITGSLGFGVLALSDKQFVVYAYPAINEQGCLYLETNKNYYEMKEGALAPPLV
jgi:hypothetical protein